MGTSQPETPYVQYKDYMIERHGAALFRVPIDFNQGCPNREADGSGGCTFCNIRGSRAVQTLGQETVRDQLTESIRFARDRYGATKFMAYIQAFTATFGMRQQAKYLDLLDAWDFTAISIGTRPDCLTPKSYEFLVALNQRIEVWVELGVQTVHDHTLERIHRDHDWASSERAIRRLHELGIKVAVHVILGLPGETPDDFKQTAKTLAALPIDAAKIHNLHIEANAPLALEHAHDPLPVFMEHEFAEHLMDFIRRMPPHIPIMRLTTDTLDEELIAPKWNMAKGQFRDYIVHQMTCREWKQGDLHGDQNAADPQNTHHLKMVQTKDGSITFWDEHYKEHYHTPAGARLEAEQKYIIPGKLKERLAQGPVQLLDVCFGLGYNSLSALNLAHQSASAKLSISALEMDRRVVRAAAENIVALETDSFDWQACLNQTLRSEGPINMLWGDARYTVTQFKPNTYNLVFLDGFSTQRNSELWTVDFFLKLKTVMTRDAVLLTYCAAIPVRAGLLEAGFFVGETAPVGRKRGGTVAAMRPEDIEIPLPEKELRTIHNSNRGLPYRDPHGIWTNKEILRDRQERILEVKSST